MSQRNTIPMQNTTHSSQRCCETGRPVAVDPNTGSTICSCKMQTGAQTYLTRVPTLPEHIYGPLHSQYPSQHPEFRQSAFYPMDASAADRLTESYKVPLPGQVPVYYDHMFPAQPFPSFPQGFDFNAARRKNATRETTGPLKAWLNAHRKNPYPTKGEKVMLAIITRMTLTQVSTWFANARRRLKKDNIYGENDYDSDDKMSKDDSVSSQNSFTEEEKRPVSDTSGLSDISDVDIEVDDVTSRRKPLKKCVQRLFSPDIRNDHVLDRIPSPEEISGIPTEADTLRSGSTEENQTNFLLPLDSILNLQNSTREKLSVENGEKYNNKSCLTTQHLLDNNGRVNNKRKMDENDVIPASKKPKIWSISEIIS